MGEILGSGFSINVRVHEGLEAFIGGESTALMQSVEGKRPFPKAQPPHSAKHGLWGKPTVLTTQKPGQLFLKSLKKVPTGTRPWVTTMLTVVKYGRFLETSNTTV
ncbi:MAG: hypothetical protein Ct9H300mP23_04440 [Nitrospinota bacterium]|nr:MAG: hypothetical protein Ct9H300mP23_04440 [Nitrospinota bacterium]